MTEYIYQINEYLDYIFTYGTFWVYSAIFAACFIENLFPPFPGDTFIIAAGGLVAVERLDLIITLITIISGGVFSVMILHTLGIKYGREYFMKKDFKYFNSADIQVMEQKFNKWGAVILIFSRFVVGVRSALAIVAGMSRYNFIKMLLFSIISYILFAGLLVYIAVTLVENFDMIIGYIKTYNLIVWPILIIVIGWFIFSKIRKVKQRKV